MRATTGMSRGRDSMPGMLGDSMDFGGERECPAARSRAMRRIQKTYKPNRRIISDDDRYEPCALIFAVCTRKKDRALLSRIISQ